MNLGNMYDPVPTPYDQTPQFSQPPINTGPAAQSVSKWEDFLGKLATDTNLQQSLVQAGLQMMTPQGPNDNAASKILQGTQVGIQGYQDRKRAGLEDERIGAVTREIGASTVGRESDNRVKIATEDEAITAQEEAATQAGQRTKVGQVEVDFAKPNAVLDLKEGQSRINANNASAASQYSGINVDKANIGRINQETENMKLYPTSGQRIGPNQLLAQSMAESVSGTTDPNNETYRQTYQNWVAKLTTQSKYKDPNLVRMEMLAEAGVYQMPEKTEAQKQKKASVIAQIEDGVKAYSNSVQGPPPAAQGGQGAPTGTPGGSTGLSPQEMQMRDAAIQDAVQRGMPIDEATRKVDAKIAASRGQ